MKKILAKTWQTLGAAVKLLSEPFAWKYNMSNRDKKYIERVVLRENVKRIIPLAVITILIQLTNLVVIGNVEIDEMLKPLGYLGSIFLLIMSVLSIVAVGREYIKKNSDDGYARFICVVYWLSEIIGVMPFIYIDFMERSSLANLILYFVVCVALPLVNIVEISIAVVTQLIIVMLMTSMYGGKLYLLVQSVVLAGITVYVSQLLYGYYIMYFMDKRRLTELESAISGASDSLEEAAERDKSTGLLNRRGLERKISTIWPYCRRHKICVTVMLIGVDISIGDSCEPDNKQMNDSILEAARKLNLIAKHETDVIVRYDSDEFLVVLTGVNMDVAVSLAMRVLKSVRVTYESTIKLSIGLVNRVPEGSFIRFFNEADIEMCSARENGGDCISSEGRFYG